ncbi:hypothetical protein [Acinetobacter nosocomialis]|uniref:hypothetical protein n=1 Tax=Acinetobacter nosocomialis TaxID=106654 RepID=UPI0021CD65DB|nr:hypothetical protein [Acinetobacter nosocomialis]MCU4454558.1 hypothetical protein [Acinetobacter nosocomialis]
MSGFEEYYKNSEWFGTYQSDLMMEEAFEAGQQSMQAKVGELENDTSLMLASHKRMSIGLLQQQDKIEKLTKERDELQKRVQFLEQELGAWKGKSIAAMINGMCKQCGKEPWQAIVSDKDGYALLHCFGCGANKYELVGEQALNGEGQ